MPDVQMLKYSFPSGHDFKQVIGRAVLDPQYRQLLFQDMGHALEGYHLSPQEINALQNITPGQFEALAHDFMQFTGGVMPGEDWVKASDFLKHKNELGSDWVKADDFLKHKNELGSDWVKADDFLKHKAEFIKDELGADWIKGESFYKSLDDFLNKHFNKYFGDPGGLSGPGSAFGDGSVRSDRRGLTGILIGLLVGILIGLLLFTTFASDSLFQLVSGYLGPALGEFLEQDIRDPFRQAFDVDQGIFGNQNEMLQAEPTPQGTDEPAANTNGNQGGSSGEQPTDEPTSEPSGDLCANNGGIQYQGEVCVCAGYVDKVTVCNDGTKFDNVTDQTCSPDPAACQDQGGGDQGGGGGKPPACGVKPCGNGSCQPECGENPNNCPADCP